MDATAISSLTTLRAISVRQPWASAICNVGVHLADGSFKSVENRGWWTGHRGPLVIHASRTVDSDAADGVKVIKRLGVVLPDEPPRGHLLGVVDMYDCIEAGSPDGKAIRKVNRWAEVEAEYYFMLRNPRALAEPIPYSGALGLFTIKDEKVVATIKELLLLM